MNSAREVGVRVASWQEPFNGTRWPRSPDPASKPLLSCRIKWGFTRDVASWSARQMRTSFWIDVGNIQDKRRLADARETPVNEFVEQENCNSNFSCESDAKSSNCAPAKDYQLWAHFEHEARVSSKSAEIGDTINDYIFWGGEAVAIANWCDHGSSGSSGSFRTCEGRFAKMPLN